MRIANESMSNVSAGVKPGDLSRVVDAFWHGAPSAWYVDSDDGAPRIANETMRTHPVDVISDDRSRVINAECEGAGRAWYIKARNALSMSPYFRCEENNHPS